MLPIQNYQIIITVLIAIQTKSRKMVLYVVKYNNLNVITVIKTIQLEQTQYFTIQKKNIQLWQEYIELFSQGLSLRKIVEKLNNQISLPTAFYWRHKILKVLSNINDDGNNKLGGIVEADETFFEESQKGNKHIKGRKARKRGYSSYV